MKKSQREVLSPGRLFFFLYCIFLLWLLFFRDPSRIEGLSYAQQLEMRTNLIPFYTIRNYLYVIIHRSNPALIRHCIINLAGNVLLFVPVGAGMAEIFPRQRRFWFFLMTGLLLLLAVEGLQLVTLLGSFDVDDIILNLLGLLLGWIPARLFWNHRPKGGSHGKKNHHI